MAFCGKCGTPTPGQVTLCPSCEEVGRKLQSKDAEEYKLMAVLSYLGILLVVPLLIGAHKKSPFANLHINQAAALFIIGCGLTIAYFIFTFLPPFILMPLLGILMSVLGLCYIYGIFTALQGKTKPIPLISRIRIFK